MKYLLQIQHDDPEFKTRVFVAQKEFKDWDADGDPAEWANQIVKEHIPNPAPNSVWIVYEKDGEENQDMFVMCGEKQMCQRKHLTLPTA